MKAKFLALVALVLGLASCQKDQAGLDVIVDGEQETTISVSLPETTRANSALGAVDNKVLDNHDLRFILEIYDGDTRIKRMVNVEDNSTSTAFDVRLIPGYPYTFVAWADFVKNRSEEDNYYNTANGLTAVTANFDNNGKWVAMTEARDAYTGKHREDSYSSASNITLKLKRPFAKLRVVTTDVEVLKNLGDVTTTNVSVDYRTKVYTGFNALTAEANTPVDLGEFEYVPNVYTETNQTDLTLLADYLFGTENGTIQFDLTATFSNSKHTTTNFNTDIPLYCNKVTTIKGNILTDGSNIKVDIKDGGAFDEDEKVINYADNAETLNEIINNASTGEETNITLGGNINLNDLLNASILSTRANEPTYGLLIPEGKSIILDLSGYTISQTKTQTGAYAMIDNRGTLTIEDSSENKSGKIIYGDTGNGGNYVSNTISNSGVLTINGGTIENNSSATVASNGYPHPIDNSGVLTINGGTFTNNANYSSMRIWCTTDDNTIVTINDGTFNGCIDFQTPSAAANKGTLTINGGTFTADTYTNCSVRLLGFGADVDEMNGYIKGGHFDGAIALRNWSGSELNSKVFNITGGTFTVDPSEFVDGDYNVVENNGVYSLELKDVIAMIGDVEYRTLQKAFDAVDNGTIQLVGNVTLKSSVVLNEGKVATLDLNGKTITATDYAIENYGTLTIKGEGNVYGIVYTESAETTINGGTYNSIEGGKWIFLNEKGKLTINGGTINKCTTYPIYSYNEGNELVINDVTVNATFGCVNAYGSGGTVVINGGTYQMTGVQGNTSHIVYFSQNITATINGGTFEKIGDINMSAAGGGGICVNGSANLTINNGNFAGDYADVYNYGGTISIKGGTYKFEPNEAFVAEGYVVDEVNGRYTVDVDVKVAKVGNTEYRKIDDAIAAWTNNTTLTLLADVTISDVVNLNSTEHHILDLGTYTMTAASGKNAFEIIARGTGASERTAITIKADANNPGCINAGSKSVVYYNYANGTATGDDRPIIKIEGGIFRGATSSFGTAGIYFKGGSAARQAATLNISGGEFYCTINGQSKSKLLISGGLFHYSVGSQGDSTALRLISGGTFKTLGFMTADSNNTKFWFGTSMGNSNVGLYINDDNYLVVGGPVITEFGDKFAAKATNATKWNSLLQYSSAQEHGLYYTNAELAIEKHKDNVVLK